MKTEREKMLAGQLYDPLDDELVAARVRTRELYRALNASAESDAEGRRRLLRKLFGAGGDSVWMQPPFFCDYGRHVRRGQSLPRDPRGYRPSSFAAFCFMMSGRTSGLIGSFANSSIHFSGEITG